MNRSGASFGTGVLCLVLAGCSLIGSADDDPADDGVTTVVLAPVSAIESQPCGRAAVADGETCLVLGQSWLTEEMFASASIGESPGNGVAVFPVLTDEGLKAFNQIAERCFEQTGDCATGMIAVVDDEGLVSAPTVNAAEFERDQLVIIGDLTESRAQALADALSN